MMALIDLANPTRFLSLAARVLPWLAAATLIMFVIGIVMAFNAPDDYQQGAAAKIMFLHVPAAWLAMACWAMMSIAALGTLVWRHPLADVAAKAAAPIGAALTLVCLVTGSLWGRPMWGTWWEWDGRLTSVLVMFLLYVAYIALRASMDDEQKAARAAAILALVGSVNLPIIHFSVEWWNSIHQGSSLFRKGGPAMPPVFWVPLLLMALAYMSAFGSLWLVGIRGEVWRRRAEAAQLRAARG